MTTYSLIVKRWTVCLYQYFKILTEASVNSMQINNKLGFPCDSAGKESACNAGDLGLIPGLGRSPKEGKGYLLHYSGLENSMDCLVHGVSKIGHGLATFTHTLKTTWEVTKLDFILDHKINLNNQILQSLSLEQKGEKHVSPLSFLFLLHPWRGRNILC